MDPLWQAGVKLLGALVVILPLVYLVTRIYSRRLHLSNKRRALRVVDAVALGPNRTVFLVEVAGRILVIAATQREMTLLTEIRDEQFLERIQESVERS